MRKPLLTSLLAPLLLVSCSCSHHETAAPVQAAATKPASPPATRPALRVEPGNVAPVEAAAGKPAGPGQVLRITLLDEHSRQPVYHAGLTLAGARSLQWTDRQGRYQWSDGFPVTGAIEIRCPALRAETGRKLKTVAYAIKDKDQLTDVDAGIDSAACVEPAEKSSTGDYRGTFFPYYGHGAFIPCGGMPADAGFYGNAKAAWVNLGNDASGQMAKLRESASIDAGSDKPIYVELSGSLTGPGGYGQQSAFAYKLEATAVAKVTADFPGDCPAATLE